MADETLNIGSDEVNAASPRSQNRPLGTARPRSLSWNRSWRNRRGPAWKSPLPGNPLVRNMSRTPPAIRRPGK